MSEIKVGDRVRFISDSPNKTYIPFVHQYGTVVGESTRRHRGKRQQEIELRMLTVEFNNQPFTLSEKNFELAAPTLPMNSPSEFKGKSYRLLIVDDEGTNVMGWNLHYAPQDVGIDDHYNIANPNNRIALAVEIALALATADSK